MNLVLYIVKLLTYETKLSQNILKKLKSRAYKPDG